MYRTQKENDIKFSLVHGNMTSSSPDMFQSQFSWSVINLVSLSCKETNWQKLQWSMRGWQEFPGLSLASPHGHWRVKPSLFKRGMWSQRWPTNDGGGGDFFLSITSTSNHSCTLIPWTTSDHSLYSHVHN